MTGEVTHLVPPSGTGLMPCCGKTPLEVPRNDRMTAHREHVTCRTEDGERRQEIAAAWFAGYSAGNLDGYFGTHEARDESPYADLDPYRQEATDA